MPNAFVRKVWTPLEWINVKLYKSTETGRWYYRKSGKQMKPVKGMK